MVFFGALNDLLMRASAPSVGVLAVLSARVLVIGGARRGFLLLVLLVMGAVTPFSELRRGLIADRLADVGEITFDVALADYPPHMRSQYLVPVSEAGSFLGYPVLRGITRDLAYQNGRRYPAAAGSSVESVLSNGWMQPEDWGVWTEGKEASLTLPCSSRQPPGTLVLEWRGLVLPNRSGTNARVSVADTLVWTGLVGDTVSLSIPLVAQGCEAGSLTVDIEVLDPASPASLGHSADGRKRGIGLIAFTLLGSES